MYVKPVGLDALRGRHDALAEDLKARGLATVQVRDPDLRDLLPPEGRLVPESGYWLRRIADGDVVEADPSVPAEPAAETQAETKE